MLGDDLSEEQLMDWIERMQKQTPKAKDIIEHMMIKISRLEKRMRELEGKDET